MYVSPHAEIRKYGDAAELIVKMPHRLLAESYPLGPWTGDLKKLWTAAQEVFAAETDEALRTSDYDCYDTLRIHREVANALGLH